MVWYVWRLALRVYRQTTENDELVTRLLSGCGWTGSNLPAKELRGSRRTQGFLGRNFPLATTGHRLGECSKPQQACMTKMLLRSPVQEKK